MLNKLRRIFYREPDFIIGGAKDPHMLRWWIIPHNRFFNIYLHKFLRDDNSRVLHDHPWWSISCILKGGYIEHILLRTQEYDCPARMLHTIARYKRKPWQFVFRKATAAHRVELYKFGFLDTHFAPNDEKAYENFKLINNRYRRSLPAWTLFITGRSVREWGFHCPQGWRHWKDFTNPVNTGEVGRGCE